MKFQEYQGKVLFEEYGIPTQPFHVVTSGAAGRKAADDLGGGTVVLKAQILAGGRGKAGGVKLAHSPEEVSEKCEAILGLTIGGFPVRKVMVTPAVTIKKEFYMGITLDRGRRGHTLILSASGGVEIEQQAEMDPSSITTMALPSRGEVDRAALKQVLGEIFPREFLADVERTVLHLYQLFREKDCSLAEINPYALTEEGCLMALDAKVVIDDNALFRQKELATQRNSEEYSEDEIDARQCGLSFVSMEGNVGCIVNGAGLAMATMDLVKLFGGDPANFLDVGGSSHPQKVLDAFRIISKNRKVNSILINIFGGITRCDDVANGIVMAKRAAPLALPIVIRLVGTNEAKGWKILQGAGLEVERDLSEAVKRVVALGKKSA